MENRLRLATDWVESVASIRPVSFRAPRLFGSTAMINVLEQLGYVSDVSYPMYYLRDRLAPYHGNFMKCRKARLTTERALYGRTSVRLPVVTGYQMIVFEF